jgi:hypothetical protein
MNGEISTSREPSSEPMGRVFVCNLILILALGVAVCGWILRYTEWFPMVGGVLTLGGAFSWLAFVSKILPEERLKRLQEAAYRYVFNSRVTFTTAILLLAACVLAASQFGTVQVEPVQESVDRSVWIYAAGEPRGEPLRLSPGGQVRELVRTGWGTPAERIIKVSGFPDKRITVRFGRRVELHVPTSFRRPVVLLQPSPDLINAVRNEIHKLRLTINTYAFEIDFEGSAIWIGCDEDVAPPNELLDLWRSKFAAQHVERLIRPRALTNSVPELEVGQKLRVELLKDGNWKLLKEFVVKPMADRQGFDPQLEVVHATQE